jgi:DNA-binding NtrC family response regulator
MKNKPTVLYIDDEFINRELFEINFKNIFNVLVTDSGVKALDFLNKNSNIDCVITDMKMPVMNGMEFLKIANEKYLQIIYFILTGFGITNEIQHAIDIGLILKYFSKPFDILDIELTIKDATKNKESKY